MAFASALITVSQADLESQCAELQAQKKVLQALSSICCCAYCSPQKQTKYLLIIVPFGVDASTPKKTFVALPTMQPFKVLLTSVLTNYGGGTQSAQKLKVAERA
jgi:hypothetical protein